MHPAPHAIAFGPNVFDKIAVAATCFFFVQHVCDLTHREHLKLPHAIQIFASNKFVANLDMSGEHAHPIPAAAMVWLHSVSKTDPLFSELCNVVPELFFESVTQCEQIDPEWLAEACVIAGRYAEKRCDTFSSMPPYAIRVKSPSSTHDALLPALRLASNDIDARAASLLLYHLSVERLSSTLTIEKGVASNASGAYSLLGPVMPKYASECTFAVTGDRFIHLCLRMHLPSWCTMLSPGGCYRDLSSMIPATVNDLVRPYVDAQVSDLIRSRDSQTDDIVLFVVASTLISEICGSASLGVRYNRDIIFAEPGLPVPFVLCDFPVSGLLTDAYGFVDGTRLVVCNGLGVDTAISLWIDALSDVDCASIVTNFVSGRADSTNPLRKYS